MVPLSRRSIDFSACIDTVIPPMHHAWYSTLCSVGITSLGRDPQNLWTHQYSLFFPQSVFSRYFELNALFFDELAGNIIALMYGFYVM